MSPKYPRLTIDGLILNKKNEILLIKRAHQPFGGHWVLPGGHVEYSEKTEEAVRREVKEETGLATKIKRLLGVYSDPRRDPRYHAVSCVYLLKIKSGRLSADWESSEIKFFSLKKLPRKIGFDHRKIIKDFIKFQKND